MPFEAGREETIRYHKELYNSFGLYKSGSWLYKPTQFVMNAAVKVADKPKLTVLDLGAGVGRHAIAIAQKYPSAIVTCVDLLPEAIEQLVHNADEAGVQDRILAQVADIESYEFSGHTYDLIISCSCIEHVSSRSAFIKVLKSIQSATAPLGVVALMIVADAKEISPTEARSALMELNLSSSDVMELLKEIFGNWDSVEMSSKLWATGETRQGEGYTLESTCIQLSARKPSGESSPSG